MGLSDIQEPESILKAIHECDQMGQAAFLRKYGFRKARDYSLWHEGTSYPSKAIVGVAHGYEFLAKGPLHASDFSGGEATVAQKLRALGFDVRRMGMAKNPPWSRDELILALNLYFQHPPQHIGQNHPAVLELSRILNTLPAHGDRPDPDRFRNPNGVYMKLCNFLRFDPTYEGKGLRGGGALEKRIWEEFAGNRERLAIAAAQIVAGARSGSSESSKRVELEESKIRHFVVYHNPDSMGWKLSEAPPSGTAFSIVTAKPVANLLGARIWLITGEGEPRQYSLYSTFIVDAVDRDVSQEYPNILRGEEGQYFWPMVPIDGQPWFQRFREMNGNFAFGLQRISDAGTIAGLLSIARGAIPSRGRIRKNVGAGFGSPTNNRLVEQAAIRTVKQNYRRRNWIVQSVETEGRGYDLQCSKGSHQEHVEVKGIRGGLCTFIITANERDTATRDPFYRLCAVTDALGKPALNWFSGAEIFAHFELEPTAYWVRPKKL